MTYPFKFKEPSDPKEVEGKSISSISIKTYEGENAYDKQKQKCIAEFGVKGPNSLKCWRIVAWRELSHLLGGFALSLVPVVVLLITVDPFIWLFAPAP